MDIIRTLYYIQGAWGDKNIFAVLYVSLCYGPYTHCYKTTVFLHLLVISVKKLHYGERLRRYLKLPTLKYRRIRGDDRSHWSTGPVGPELSNLRPAQKTGFKTSHSLKLVTHVRSADDTKSSITDERLTAFKRGCNVVGYHEVPYTENLHS